MCLLKVYVTDGKSSRNLVAEGIALVTKEDGKIKLKNLEFKETSLENVEIVLIDVINSMLLLKKGADKI